MRNRGFTLIELTVVLAVLVIASGFVIVRITGWSTRQSLHASARALGNTIRTWRGRARTEELAYRLVFEEKAYRIEAGKEVLRKGYLGSGETFDPGAPPPLIFSPRGIAPQTRITIRNDHGERVSLLLGALLNEVEYQEER